MFGPYEIECDGREYVGNVSLKELHKFCRDGDTYLFVVETMAAHRISEMTSRIIDRVGSSFGSLVPLEMIKELRKLDLVVEDGIPAKKSGANGDNSNGADGKRIPSISAIILFVAQECNLRCVYCYGEGGEYGGKGIMTDETAYRAVDWLLESSKELEKVTIFFFGGEPLLNFPVIKKTVAYAKAKASEKNKKVGFGMTTNGSLLTDEIISFIRNEKIKVQVSFDGPPEIHDRQRPFKNGMGSYTAVSENIRNLLAVIPDLMVRGTVCEDADPREIKKGIKEEGVKKFMVIEATPVICAGKEGSRSYKAEKEMSGSMISFQEEEYDEFFESVKNRTIVENTATKWFLTLITGKKRYFGCGMGKRFAAVSTSGDIYPCHRFVGLEEVKLGTVTGYTPESINEYHRSIVNNLPGCSVCWTRYLCGGGCFYVNRAQTGDMRVAEVSFCDETKAAMEKAISMCTRFDDDDRKYVKEIAPVNEW